jgi:hypothetical protein
MVVPARWERRGGEHVEGHGGRHDGVLVKLSKVQGWQVDGLMLRGERMFQGSREG